MPTNRRRRTRQHKALSRYERMVLVLGSGMSQWTDADREHYRELWRIHGRQLIEEADARGSGWPFAEVEFGDPEDKA